MFSTKVAIMRRSRILVAALAVLTAVFAAQLAPHRLPARGQRLSTPPLVWQPMAPQEIVLPPRGAAHPDRLTVDAPQTMLIPTEIPADSTKLLPNFTPPAPVRLLAIDKSLGNVIWVARAAD